MAVGERNGPKHNTLFWSQFQLVEELAACCAVNTTWRDVFNQDTLWRVRCREETAKYLKTAKCQVEPHFVSPETEDSTLSPICDYRLSYMKEVHMFGNWCKWNMIRFDLEATDCQKLGMCYFVSNDHLLLADEWVMKLYDVSVTPPLYICEPFKLIKGGFRIKTCCETFGNNKLLVMQEKCIQIYSIASPIQSQWTLEHVLDIQEGEMTFEEAEAKSQKRSELFYVERIVLENKLVSYVNEDKDFYIWDLTNAKLIKKESVPQTAVEITSIKSSKESTDFIVVYRLKNSSKFDFTVYSLAELRFYTFNTSCCLLQDNYPSDSCVIIENFVAIHTESLSMKIYNYKTDQLIAEIANNVTVGPRVSNNRIYFVVDDKFSYFDTASKKFQSLKGRLSDDVEDFAIVCNKFFKVKSRNCCKIYRIVNKSMKVTALESLKERIPGMYNLWEVCYYDGWAENKSCTRMAVEDIKRDHIVVFNFW